MSVSIFFRRFLRVLIAGALLAIGFMPVIADAESVQITSAPPSGSISPGTVINFSAAGNGFVDPKYSVSDSFSASGATTGTIDAVGFFTWTPGIYDAGKHTLTVAVTDSLQHSASTTVTILVASNSVIVTNISPGPTVAVQRPITFTIAAPGFITPNFTVYDTSAASSITSANTSSTGLFSWTPGSDDIGTHQLSVVASDVYGHNAQIRQTITVITPTVSILSLSPGSGASVGATVSFTAIANQLAKPTYSVSDSSNGTSTITASTINSAGIFSWKPSDTDIGFHTLTVTAADAVGNAASTTLMLSVTPASTSAAVPAANITQQTATLPAASAPVSNAVSASAPIAPAPQKSKYIFTTALAIGSRGAAVTELQKRLLALGFFSGAATGYYGAVTAASVKQFQAAHGVARIGSVGPATRALLNKN